MRLLAIQEQSGSMGSTDQYKGTPQSRVSLWKRKKSAQAQGTTQWVSAPLTPLVLCSGLQGEYTRILLLNDVGMGLGKVCTFIGPTCLFKCTFNVLTLKLS